MTERQQRFVAEYAKDCNGTQAAVRAGFGKRGAHVTASRLLRNANIAAAIEEARGPVLLTSQITLESHLAELAKIRDAAFKAGQFSAAHSAEATRGKAAGFSVDRIRIEDLRGLPDTDLEAIAAGKVIH